MWKYIFSTLILAFLVTVNVPSLVRNYNNPCVYHVCPDYGSGGGGLLAYVVDKTPPNFYVPAGTFCGVACIDHPAYVNWSLFAFDIIMWTIATLVIFRLSRKKQLMT